MIEPRLLAAPVSGWSAFVVDALLRKHLRPYLAGMTERQRRELERTRRAVHTAARMWEDSASASGTTETVGPETEPESDHDELTIAEAAAVLRLTARRVRQLASQDWSAHGFARKVGRSWLIQREALTLTAASHLEQAWTTPEKEEGA